MEQEAFALKSKSATPPFSRSVTTGAKMPWQGQEAKPLGPPRAFHPHHYPSSLPTITMSFPQSAGLTKVVCKPDPPAQSQCKSETYTRSLEVTQPTSPFQLDFSHQDNANDACKAEGLNSMELSDVAVKMEPTWNAEAATTLLGRGYNTQTSLRSTESTLSFYPTHGSLSSVQTPQAVEQQNFPPSDLAWIDDTQLPSNSMLHSAPVTHLSGGHPYPMLDVSTGGAVGALTRCLSETLLGLPTGLAPHGEHHGRREGLRPLRSLPKRKFRATKVDLDRDWYCLDDDDDNLAGGSPCSSRGEAEDGGVGDAQERRLRRRNNNRESARRVKEKRNSDLREVNCKVEQLQVEQEVLLGQCSSMHDSCLGLQRELQELRGRWGDNQAENHRLLAELNHLRKNVGLASSGAANSGNLKPGPTAALIPGAYAAYVPTTPGMQYDGAPLLGSLGGDQGLFALNGGPLASEMGQGLGLGFSWSPTKPEVQATHDQDWRNWG